jgi:hypothetical protein
VNGETTNRERSRTRRDLLRGLALGAGVGLAGCLTAAGTPRSPGRIARRFEFAVGHRRETIRVTVPASLAARVDGATHSVTATMRAARDRQFLDTVGRELVARAGGRAAAVLAAQSLAAGIEYVTDLDSVGRREFVRYPVETVRDAEGDCEDKAILLAGLLSSEAIGCRTALVFPRGHCATLVARADLPAGDLADDPLTVTLGGTEYVYVESVESVTPGRAARDYGERPWLGAYTDRWHVLDAGAVVDTVEAELGRRLSAADLP